MLLSHMQIKSLVFFPNYSNCLFVWLIYSPNLVPLIFTILEMP